MTTIPVTQGAPQASNFVVETALPVTENISRTDGQTVLTSMDTLFGNLLEDRNSLFVGGGLISYTSVGTVLTFSDQLDFTYNNAGTQETITSIVAAAGTITFTANGNMAYITVTKGSPGSATLVTNATSLPAATTTQEVFLLAVRRDDLSPALQRIYLKGGSSIATGETLRLNSPSGGTLSNITVGTEVIQQYLDMTEIATPSDPSSGILRVYSKSGDALYTLNSSGTETQVGSGSGQKNYVQASSNTATGWLKANTSQSAGVATITTDTTAANIPRPITTKTATKILPVAVSNTVNAGTFTATNATPTVLTFSVNGMQSGYVVYLANSGGALPTGLSASTPYWVTMITQTTAHISSSHANYLTGTFVAASSTGTGTQYYGCEMGLLQFTLDPADYNTKLQANWAQNILSGATGDWQVDVYSNTASSYTYNTYSRLPLSTDSSLQTLLPNLEGTFKTTFDAPGSAQQYIEIRFQNVSSTEDTHALEISDLIIGPGIPVQGAVVTQWQSYTPVAGNQGTGGYAAQSGYYRRVGDSLEVEFTIQKDGSGGTGSSNIFVNLPTGYTINQTAIPSTVATGSVFGIYETGGAHFAITNSSNGTSSVDMNGFTGVSFTAGLYLRGRFTVPVNELAGSGTLNVSQNDVMYAWNSSATTTTDQTGTNNGYGPGGMNFQAFAPTGVSQIAKRVVFQNPVPVGTSPILEVDGGTSGADWVKLSDRLGTYGINTGGTAAWGATVSPVNSTTYDVRFAATYDQLSTDTWSNLTSWKWRLSVGLPGQAVGFGIVQPGVSSGLVSASGVPGNTTGNAIASGYVGEKLTTSLSAVTLSGTSYGSTIGTLSITAGVWLLYVNTDYTKGTANTGYGIVRVQNTTDGTTVIGASTVCTPSSVISEAVVTLVGYLDISATKSVSVQAYDPNNTGSIGMGINSSGQFSDNTFTAVRIA